MRDSAIAAGDRNKAIRSGSDRLLCFVGWGALADPHELNRGMDGGPPRRGLRRVGDTGLFDVTDEHIEKLVVVLLGQLKRPVAPRRAAAVRGIRRPDRI